MDHNINMHFELENTQEKNMVWNESQVYDKYIGEANDSINNQIL